MAEIKDLDILTAEKPAEAMWERYRDEMLGGMGEESTAICKNVFFTGMAMAESYFHFAMSQNGTTFTRMMERFSDELENFEREETNH